MISIRLFVIFCCIVNLIGNISAIVHGRPAAPGSFPVLVSLRNTENVHFCGGTIISQRWILTAGRCVSGKKPTDILAFVGAQTRTDGSKYTIKEIHVHPKFGRLSLENDIALLKTIAKIQWVGKFVRPATLPRSAPATGIWPVFIPGWGAIKVGSETEIRFVHSIEIFRIIDRKPMNMLKCQRNYIMDNRRQLAS